MCLFILNEKKEKEKKMKKKVFETQNVQKGMMKMNKKWRGKIAKGMVVMQSFAVSYMLMTSNVYAAGSNTSSVDGFITFICDWLIKIGGIVAMIGGVLFALGWQREDAEGKSRGLMTMMAGFMLVAIAQAPNIFGL